MIFTGHAELNIDAKQRLAIPAKHRARLTPERDGTAWYCVPCGDKKLALYTEKRFEEIVEKGELTLTRNEAESMLASTFFGMCERIEPDAAGRIVIPRLHKDTAGLGDEVVMVGCGKYLEIWDRAVWAAQFMNQFKNLPSLVNEVNNRGAKAP